MSRGRRGCRAPRSAPRPRARWRSPEGRSARPARGRRPGTVAPPPARSGRADPVAERPRASRPGRARPARRRRGRRGARRAFRESSPDSTRAPIPASGGGDGSRIVGTADSPADCPADCSADSQGRPVTRRRSPLRLAAVGGSRRRGTEGVPGRPWSAPGSPAPRSTPTPRSAGRPTRSAKAAP